MCPIFSDPEDDYGGISDREGDNLDDGDTEDDIIVNPYRDPLKGGTYPLNLVVEGEVEQDDGYVPTWKARHGWRELYQNWSVSVPRS
jgi:hypothetical protein